jgi:2-polyprenyl-3-methyl-5-hydroxy-6-metoxy-1,4-benzoquinol methylase
MRFKKELTKFLMNLRPSEPAYLKDKLSETINHRRFINSSEKEKDKILFSMAEMQFQEYQSHPFGRFFSPSYSLEELLSEKAVLDLGCWCGGMAVSMAERCGIRNMYGIDVNNAFIRAANIFASTRHDKRINYNFQVGFGESLPYEDNFFDAVVSNDVLEHVKSVKKTLEECKRIIKPGGMIFSVFPSYYDPIDGVHLSCVTKTPFLNWLFDSETLNCAYDEIIDSRGDDAYWYKSEKSMMEWSRVHGGIGINGTTMSDFKSIIKDIGFSQIHIIPNHLFAFRYPCTAIFSPLFAGDFLQDHISNRIISILIN